MVISENSVPASVEFEDLLSASHKVIDQKAAELPKYFLSRSPSAFEEDVYEALTEAATGTVFDGSIKLISGHKFPDIIADKQYGVEVKATSGKKWKSTGNSVLESTRVTGIERIYLFFGQLIDPAAFKWRLYQNCLYEVAVTHSPRYLIDMELGSGETIFDRMEIDYDTIRTAEKPIEPILNYYRGKAKRGEEPWWMGSPNDTIPFTVRLWCHLSSSEKRSLEIQAMARFPEIFGKSSTKYQKLVVWMTTHHGVVTPNIRDSFSAGGKVSIKIGSRNYNSMPQVFGHLKEQLPLVISEIESLSTEEIEQYWNIDASSFSASDKVKTWADKVSRFAGASLGSNHSFISSLLE